MAFLGSSPTKYAKIFLSESNWMKLAGHMSGYILLPFEKRSEVFISFSFGIIAEKLFLTFDQKSQEPVEVGGCLFYENFSL